MPTPVTIMTLEALARRPTTRNLIKRTGWTMLILAATRLLTSLLPYRLIAPDWYVKAGLELANISPVLAVGFLLLACSTHLDVLCGNIEACQKKKIPTLRYAAQITLWVYLLAIPSQLIASVLTAKDHRIQMNAVSVAASKQLANAREQKLPKAQQERLKRIEFQLLNARARESRQLMMSLWRDTLRVAVSAAAVAWMLSLTAKEFNDFTN